MLQAVTVVSGKTTAMAFGGGRWIAIASVWKLNKNVISSRFCRFLFYVRLRVHVYLKCNLLRVLKIFRS
jgi:hypothetical protein